MLFVALETVTVAFYVLVAYSHQSFLTEGGLKYLTLCAGLGILLLASSFFTVQAALS